MTTQAPKQTQPDELVGRVINDRFRIISVIARGGMGRVYRAEQVPLGRLVAVKTLDPRHDGGENDPQFQQRFFLEASIASKLQHPNTVTVFDYGRTVDGIYFIAMELVEGRSLLNLVRQEAPLPAARVVHIAVQIARSLREAHRLEVIHRDLKPGNVLLTRHGDEEDFVKVLDFGLVKHIESEQEQELTKAGLFMGSPKYMSPEQIQGVRVDARADIYALGVVMYEMLTGKVPFERDNTVKVLMAHMHEAVPEIRVEGCPEALSQLAMRCLAKDPDQRPSSMDEVISQLKQATGTGTMVTTSGSFALSQEVKLSGSPSAPPPGTPMRGFPYSPPSVSGTFGDSMPLPGLAVGAAPTHQPSALTAMPVRGIANWLPKVAVIAALAIASGFLALRFSERGDTLSVQSLPDDHAAPARTNKPAAQPVTPASPTPSRSATTPPVVEPTPSEPPAEPTAAARHVMVRLTSVPSGASVYADGKPYGQTPADIEWWNDAAAPGRQITFVFEKEGHEKVTVVRTIVSEKLDVEASLPPRSTAPRRRAAPSEPHADTPRGPVVTPDDFKEDPY